MSKYLQYEVCRRRASMCNSIYSSSCVFSHLRKVCGEGLWKVNQYLPRNDKLLRLLINCVTCHWHCVIHTLTDWKRSFLNHRWLFGKTFSWRLARWSTQAFHCSVPICIMSETIADHFNVMLASCPRKFLRGSTAGSEGGSAGPDPGH